MSEAASARAVSPIQQALRTATQAVHREVEALAPFFRPDFSDADYVDWLRRLQGFYAEFEAALTASETTAPVGWKHLGRQPLLAADLADLLTEPTPLAARPAGQRLVFRDADEALGGLYVVEGSALGARIILPQLTARLGLGADFGARFFAPSPAADAPRWPAFLARLTARDDAGPQRAALCRGAVDTFAALAAWLNRPQTLAAGPAPELPSDSLSPLPRVSS